MSVDRNGSLILTDRLEKGATEGATGTCQAGGRILDVARYRLTTAEILYHMPDHPRLLQTYVWQEMDLAPQFPVLHRFLDFWQRELDGKLHQVRVAHAGIIGPGRSRFVDLQVSIH